MDHTSDGLQCASLPTEKNWQYQPRFLFHEMGHNFTSKAHGTLDAHNLRTFDISLLESGGGGFFQIQNIHGNPYLTQLLQEVALFWYTGVDFWMSLHFVGECLNLVLPSSLHFDTITHSWLDHWIGSNSGTSCLTIFIWLGIVMPPWRLRWFMKSLIFSRTSKVYDPKWIHDLQWC